METPDDFCPMADEGVIDQGTGVLGRLKRRHDLPPVSSGFQRVLINGNGEVVASGEPPTQGEAYWAKPHGWVTVDIGDHTLVLDLHLRCAAPRAAFVVSVTVTASITDSAQVATRRIRSVKRIIEPALREGITAAGRLVQSVTNTDPIGALDEARYSFETQLRGVLLRQKLSLPDWIRATVNSVTVSFDTTTQTYYDKLVALGWQGALDTTDATNTLALQDLWRKHLSEFLSDPAKRSFEIVFSNPTPENIAAVVAQLNEADRERQDQVVGVLNTMLERYYVDKDGTLYTFLVKSIIAGLQGKAISPPDERVLGRPDITPQAPISTEQPSSPLGSDRDWQR